MRNFARFLDLVEVQYQDFAVAMLRYLTVRRYVTLSGGSGTSRCLQHPQVPMWDYDLFPLKPPNGYTDWIDPLFLPSRWNVVETCSNCGGTGQVARTETETETDSNGNTTTRTRTVYETCSTCNGGGHLEYTQILNTQWQKLIPSVTEPNIPVPELVENAEETIYYNLPLTENFESIEISPKIINASSPLIQEMQNTGSQMEYLHKAHKAEVERLHNGYLYRADFQIGAFQTIAIESTNLKGRFGWFFGKRPEFYFPHLPLSPIAVVTIALFPTLLVMVVGMTILCFK